MILVTELQYFPLINSYAQILQIGNVNFCEGSAFKKSTFRNRMIIAGCNGPVQMSIPIMGGRNCKAPYKDIMIDHKTDWLGLHYKTICSAYGKAPWFSEYKHDLEHLYGKKMDSLFDWNLACVNWVNKKLKVASRFNMQEVKPFDQSEVIDMVDFYKPTSYNKLSMDKYIVYQQVFQLRNGFLPNISVLDILLNEGPNTGHLLLNHFKTYS